MGQMIEQVRVKISLLIIPIGKPEIKYDSSLQKTQTLKAGQSLYLPVTVTGHPKPSITWYHGDKELVTKDNITIETVDKDSKVTVKATTGMDGGKYKIVAENKVGTTEAEFDVVIKGMLKTIFFKNYKIVDIKTCSCLRCLIKMSCC